MNRSSFSAQLSGGAAAPNSSQSEKHLTTPEVARLLGVSSPNTIKNWLESGHFPGAFRTPGGHWRFRHSDVVAMQQHMEALRQKNRRGDLTPEDSDEEADPPML